MSDTDVQNIGEIVYFKTDDLHLNEKHEEKYRMINAAFIYVAPDPESQEQKTVIPSETRYMLQDALLMNR